MGAISAGAFVVGAIQKALAVASIAMRAFGVATTLASGPIGLIVVGIAAAIGVVYALSKAFDSSTESEKLNAEIKQRVFDKTIDQRIEMQTLFNTLRRTKQGTEEYTTALKAIDQMSPGLVEKYKLQEKSLQNISLAERQLAKDIMKRAEAEVEAEMLKEALKEEARLKQQGPDWWTASMAQFSGGGSAVNTAHQANIQEQKNRAAMLSKKIEDRQNQESQDKQSEQFTAANPREAAIAAAATQSTLIIDFKNMPTGVEAGTQQLKNLGTRIKLQNNL